MLLRTRHFACLLLLISTLGIAQAQVAAPSLRCCAHTIALLLQQRGAARNHVTQSFNAARVTAATAQNLPLASLRTIWAVRPPSAHSMTVHAVTGLAPFALL
ncbi:MAG: hypothetical protein WA324_13700 [Bryobacteraceae bacterium]